MRAPILCIATAVASTSGSSSTGSRISNPLAFHHSSSTRQQQVQPQSTYQQPQHGSYRRRRTEHLLILDAIDSYNEVRTINAQEGIPTTHGNESIPQYTLNDDVIHVRTSPTRPKRQSITFKDTVKGDTTATRRTTSVLQQQSSIEGGDLVCRVVARSDCKLPSDWDMISSWSTSLHSHDDHQSQQNCNYTEILRQMDDIYHAKAHQQLRNLKYMQQHNVPSVNTAVPSDADTFHSNHKHSQPDKDEEKKLVATVRQSLEDSGYELLSRRDLDLCEALNVGYLLRLSIVPDVAVTFDNNIARELYPERFDPNTGFVWPEHLNDFLFDQRVLVYWRGYSKEKTLGRLLLPKLDYLQASLVQRFFGNIRTQLGRFERTLLMSSLSMYRHTTACFLYYMRNLAYRIPNDNLSRSVRKIIRSPYFYSSYKALNNGRLPTVSQMKANRTHHGGNSVFTLSRYGGTKTKFVGAPNPRDALNPFIICEESNECSVGDESTEECLSTADIDECQDRFQLEAQQQQPRVQRVNQRIYESLNRDDIRCPYDENVSSSLTKAILPPMQLLERVTISNLVDIFTKEGRRNLMKTIFAKSELIEPTYEEVVVVWRPLIENKQQHLRKFVPPKIVYDVADMFDMQDILPVRTKVPESADTIPPLEIRTFEGVPMANLPAVLPKTKLIFRPADAFVFDLMSILSFAAIIGSVRFDNPKLDFIAIVSVGLWVIRTVLRYSNKLARYDLLVKNFLTSKITHRNVGALRYITNEAGSKRAKRAALVHMWLTDNRFTNGGSVLSGPLIRSQLVALGQFGLQSIMNVMKRTPIDIDAALNDLEALQLVRRLDSSGQLLDVTRDEKHVSQGLKETWGSLLSTGINTSKVKI
jgi:Protein of unknown function (DUF3754)